MKPFLQFFLEYRHNDAFGMPKLHDEPTTKGPYEQNVQIGQRFIGADQLGAKLQESFQFNKEYYHLTESFTSNDIDMEKAYELFNREYLQSTGKSWNKDKFFGRARNWEFWGDENGFVATRSQRSGFVKLVGAAGSDKSKYKGFKELVIKNLPVWGMVDEKIGGLLKKMGYRGPNMMEKMAFKGLMKSGQMDAVLGGAKLESIDGDKITLTYSDIGTVTKYFMGSPEYWRKLHWKFLKKESLEFDEEYKRLMKPFKVINEKVYSEIMVAYHRTKNNPENSPLLELGIMKHTNLTASYGTGLYSTYKLEDQNDDRMKALYGDYIIKGKINLRNFVILDEEVYQTINRDESFEEYIKNIDYNIASYKKLSKRDGYDSDLWKKINIVKKGGEEYYDDDENDRFHLSHTSEIASEYWEKFKSSGYDGVIFTGRRDGHVVVAWKKNSFLPFGYSTDDGMSWNKLTPNIKKIYKSVDDEDYDPQQFNKKTHKRIISKINKKSPHISKLLSEIGDDPLKSYDFIKSNDNIHNELLKILIKNISTNSDTSFLYATEILKGDNVPTMILYGMNKQKIQSYLYFLLKNHKTIPDNVYHIILQGGDPLYIGMYLNDIIQKYEYTIPDNILFLIHKFPSVNMHLIDLYLSQNKKVPNVLYSNIKYFTKIFHGFKDHETMRRLVQSNGDELPIEILEACKNDANAFINIYRFFYQKIVDKNQVYLLVESNPLLLQKVINFHNENNIPYFNGDQFDAVKYAKEIKKKNGGLSDILLKFVSSDEDVIDYMIESFQEYNLEIPDSIWEKFVSIIINNPSRGYSINIDMDKMPLKYKKILMDKGFLKN